MNVPFAKIEADRLPWCEIMGQQTSMATGFIDV